MDPNTESFSSRADRVSYDLWCKKLPCVNISIPQKVDGCKQYEMSLTKSSYHSKWGFCVKIDYIERE